MSEKRKMPEGRRFQKGQSGNPAGRPAMPEGLKQLKRLTKDEFTFLVGQYWQLPVSELERIVNDKEILNSMTAMDACLAQAIYDMAKNGKLNHLELFLDRTIGTVSQNLNLTGNLNASITDFIASRKKMEKPGG